MCLLKGASSLAPNIYAGAQLTKKDVSVLAQAGIKTIICNRPDGEEAHQTSFADIQQEANKFNIKTIYIAFTMSKVTDQHIKEMKEALEKSEKPIFAYCRSGGRVKGIYSLITW